MKIWKSMLPYVGVTAAAFYLLPAVMKNTGVAMVSMLAIMPLLCFVMAAMFGRKYGFCVWYGVLIGLLFVPSLFLFYNASAWVYAPVYGLIALVGNLLGKMAASSKRG